MANRFLTLTVLAASCLGLVACGSADGEGENRSLLTRVGIAAGGPDEFLVIERNPLVIPPSLRGPLPTPQVGAPSLVTPRSDSSLAQALSGGSSPLIDAPGPSAGEIALMSFTAKGADTTGIRAVIDAEHDETMSVQQNTLWWTLTGRPLFNPYEDQKLDPVAELERLMGRYPDARFPTFDPLAVPAEEG